MEEYPFVLHLSHYYDIQHVRIVSPLTDSLSSLMEKLKENNIFNMPSIDSSGAHFNYYFAIKDSDNLFHILRPQYNNKEMHLTDYGIKPEDTLEIVRVKEITVADKPNKYQRIKNEIIKKKKTSFAIPEENFTLFISFKGSMNELKISNPNIPLVSLVEQVTEYSSFHVTMAYGDGRECFTYWFSKEYTNNKEIVLFPFNPDGKKKYLSDYEICSGDSLTLNYQWNKRDTNDERYDTILSMNHFNEDNISTLFAEEKFYICLSYKNETKYFDVLDPFIPLESLMNNVKESKLFSLPTFDSLGNYLWYYLYKEENNKEPTVLFPIEAGNPKKLSLLDYGIKSGEHLMIMPMKEQTILSISKKED